MNPINRLCICAFVLAQFLLFSVAIAQTKQLPYFTGFDSPAEQNGWTEYRSGYASAFQWTNNNELFHDYNVGGASTQTVIDWYVSPPINFSVTARITMKVKASGVLEPTPNNLEVLFTSGSGNPAQSTYSYIGNLSFTQPKEKWVVIDLPVPYTAPQGRFAFRFISVGNAWMTYYIDSITVKASPGIVGIEKELFEPGQIGIMATDQNTRIWFPSLMQRVDIRLRDADGKLIAQVNEFTGQEIILAAPCQTSNSIKLLEVEGEGFRVRKKFVVVCD